MQNEAMYEQLGVSRAVYEYGESILRDLRPRFDQIDSVAEYNQGKVLAAMQKNRVNATHFAATTGYGYDDEMCIRDRIRNRLINSLPIQTASKIFLVFLAAWMAVSYFTTGASKHATPRRDNFTQNLS